jgi:hypothetical protein
VACLLDNCATSSLHACRARRPISSPQQQTPAARIRYVNPHMRLNYSQNHVLMLVAHRVGYVIETYLLLPLHSFVSQATTKAYLTSLHSHHYAPLTCFHLLCTLACCLPQALESVQNTVLESNCLKEIATAERQHLFSNLSIAPTAVHFQARCGCCLGKPCYWSSRSVKYCRAHTRALSQLAFVCIVLLRCYAAYANRT